MIREVNLLFPFDPHPAQSLCAELDEWHQRLAWRDWHGRQWSGPLRRDIDAEAIAASIRLGGVNVTVDEGRRILAGDIPPAGAPPRAGPVRRHPGALPFAPA